jgi:hypothetical protein
MGDSFHMATSARMLASTHLVTSLAGVVLFFAVYFRLFDCTDALWPFGQNRQLDRGSDNSFGVGILLDADVDLPESAVNGLASPNTWCGKAAAHSKTKCDLLLENERMFLASLVANCHLEAMQKPPVLWHPTHALREASSDQQNLVILVAGQLEATCSKFGVSWSLAMATEQGQRFKEIHEHLAQLRSAAATIVDSTASSVHSFEDMEQFSAKLSTVQEDVLKQTQNIDALTTSLSEQLTLIDRAGQKATDVYLASEEKFRSFAASLTTSMESLPEAANTFKQNSERLETLLKEQSRLAELETSPATATSILLVSVIISAGFLYSGMSLHLFCSSLGLATLKLLAVAGGAKNSNSLLSFLDPLALLARASQFLLLFIPYQALFLASVLAIVWELSPAAVQKSFLGDTQSSMLAQARTEAAEATSLAKHTQNKAEVLKKEVELLTTNQTSLEGQATALYAKVATKDTIIQKLESKLREARGMQKDATASLHAAQVRVKDLEEKAISLAADVAEKMILMVSLHDQLVEAQQHANDRNVSLVAAQARTTATEQGIVYGGDNAQPEELRAELQKLKSQLAQSKEDHLAAIRTLRTTVASEQKLTLDINLPTESEAKATLEQKSLKNTLERSGKRRQSLPRSSSFWRNADTEGSAAGKNNTRAYRSSCTDDDDDGDEDNSMEESDGWKGASREQAAMQSDGPVARRKTKTPARHAAPPADSKQGEQQNREPRTPRRPVDAAPAAPARADPGGSGNSSALSALLAEGGALAVTPTPSTDGIRSRLRSRTTPARNG